MKKPKLKQKKQPQCLASLDYEILCKTEGTEFADKVMLTAIGLRKERLARNVTN